MENTIANIRILDVVRLVHGYSGTWNSTKKMNVNLTNFSVKEIPKFITNHYEKFIIDQLKNYMKPETDSKLQTFAKCYEEFKIQPYLSNKCRWKFF
jgi:inhibitor of KinA sporulation pathway (predicted exonuclease)